MASSNARPWRKSILRQLRSRNQREITPFQDLIQIHNRIVERISTLQLENSQLAFINERLKDEIKNLKISTGNKLESKSNPSGSLGDQVVAINDAAAQATITMLEKKLFAIQEELTELHRRKGENAQQIIDQSAQLKNNERLLEDRTQTCTKLKKELEESKEIITRLQSRISELESTNQLLMDEYQASQLECTTKERELLESRKLNTQMETQILQLKEREVEFMNRENEVYQIRNEERIRKQLEEAANENKAVVHVNRSGKKPIGYEQLDSAICALVRIPNRAYLKFEAHDGEINAIKWSPHGLNVATGGSDRKIKLWDISKATANLCGVLSGSNSSIMSIDYDSSGSVLLAASYNDFACRVWTVDDLKLRNTFTGHTKEVLSAKFMDDCSKFVSASHDRTLRIWDLKSKACINTKFAGSMCNDVVCADTNIISGHYDKTLKFWDIRSGTKPTHTETVGAKVTSLDVSRNGNWLLACARDNTIHLFDLRTNSKIKVFATDGFTVTCDWTRANFSPDSEYISVGSADGTVYIWNVNDSSKLETSLRGEHKSGVVSVAWQPAGNGLTTCDKAKNVVVWADI